MLPERVWKVGDASLCNLFKLVPGGTVPVGVQLGRLRQGRQLARPGEAVSGDESQRERGPAARGGTSLALATLCTLLFLTFLDNTVVSVALGQIYRRA